MTLDVVFVNSFQKNSQYFNTLHILVTDLKSLIKLLKW
jgi:hypothetical protein